VINTLLKNIFRRQRPQERERLIRLPKSHSFPSGHSLLAAATFPIIAHHLTERRGPAAQTVAHSLAGITILSIGFSRVYFGVHFPSDVLAGFAAGAGWLGLTSLTHTLLESRRGGRRAAPRGRERPAGNRQPLPNE
jgi:membrane-associated phospholipid phosphatase